MSNLVQAAKEAASTPLTPQEIINFITHGRIKKLSDIVQVFKFTTDFQKLVSDLRNSAQTLSQFSIALNTRAQTIKGNITDVIADTWLQQPDVTGDAARAVRQNIETTQHTLRGRMLPAVADLEMKTKAITEGLMNLPFSGRQPSIEAKVASYQRWSRIAMNMPCSRQATKAYEVEGYRGSFDYLQFYNCLIDEIVRWPNHHIPYVKIQFD